MFRDKDVHGSPIYAQCKEIDSPEAGKAPLLMMELYIVGPKKKFHCYGTLYVALQN